MQQWLGVDPLAVAVIAAGVAAALLSLTLLFLILWRRARSARDRIDRDRAAAARDRLDLELALAEQTSRLRIVRESAEVIVHALSVVASQADGARFAGGSDPAVATRTAAVIADTARTAIADLRRVLALIREGEAEAGPSPGLDSLRELGDAFAPGGLEVEFRQTGEPFEPGDGATLAIYRIVDQALENALRHGGPGTRAVVTLRWTADGLEVLVDDDGTRAAARRSGLDPDTEAQQRPYTQEDDLAALTQPPVGRGITEMRERTELFGGVFSAGPVPGVGFSVLAIFPALRGHNGIAGVRLGE